MAAIDTPRQTPPDTLVERLSDVHARMSRALASVGRDAASVTLVAVSKQQTEERVSQALASGLRVFGENRVQEARARWLPLRENYPGIKLHLVGPLQTNKVKEAVALFDAIHTLDRPKLAAALAEEMARTGYHPRLLIEVNTGEEPQKNGVAPSKLGAFLAECRTSYGLMVDGLMCVPPAHEPPALHFTLLSELARDHGLRLLSMGMSADFETAIRCGATHIRVGSAIFGPRVPSFADPALTRT